jgi:uncharacterized cupredoxin-like copper-binding protein
LSKFRKGSALVILVALVALVAAVSALGGLGQQTATTNVAVTAGKPSELRFTLSRQTILKGTGVFKVTNRGKLPHNFKIAGKKTPILGTGKVSILRATFTKAGRYPYLCTVPGHAAGGMKGVLVVK